MAAPPPEGPDHPPAGPGLSILPMALPSALALLQQGVFYHSQTSLSVRLTRPILPVFILCFIPRPPLSTDGGRRSDGKRLLYPARRYDLWSLSLGLRSRRMISCLLELDVLPYIALIQGFRHDWSWNFIWTIRVIGDMDHGWNTMAAGQRSLASAAEITNHDENKIKAEIRPRKKKSVMMVVSWKK